MQLDPITHSDLRRFVLGVQDTQSGVIGIVLINGVTIYGVLPAENKVKEGHLRLKLNEKHNEKIVEVPIKHISGLYKIDLCQTGPSISLLGGDKLESAEIWMYHWTENVAESFDYEIEDLELIYNITVTSEFSRGDIEFASRTPLYCDWEFFSNKAGGLRSIGVSAMGFGGSAGWDSSLWKQFEDSVERHETELDQIHGRSDAVVAGYVDFIETPESNLTEEMEGEEWFAALISSSRPSGRDDLADKWSIGYFRSDSFMFPRRHWDKISEPIHVFGEVVDTNVETPFGDVDSYIKARGSASLD
ncbi:hypothetical protein ACOZ4B_10755 [Haloferax prahovense]|uniref:hypothetical protein n=1 Tax=Haloferax prahovense TaxID=381852 RepID=UPI003C7118B1